MLNPGCKGPLSPLLIGRDKAGYMGNDNPRTFVNAGNLLGILLSHRLHKVESNEKSE